MSTSLTVRSVSFVLAATITLAVMAGIDALANVETAAMPQMSQVASTPAQG